MMERTRVLMYSEHTEFYYAWWILQNQYNSIICVTNYDEAENLLMTCTFHIIIIDYRRIDKIDKINEILIHRNLPTKVLVFRAPELPNNFGPYDVPVDAEKVTTTGPGNVTDSTDSFSEKEGVLTIGAWVIDTKMRRVTYNNTRVKLTRIQFDLLYCLASHKNTFLTYDQLIEYVWRGEPYENNVVKTHVSRLRKQLSEVTGRDNIINEKGYGYRFSK